MLALGRWNVASRSLRGHCGEDAQLVSLDTRDMSRTLGEELVQRFLGWTLRKHGQSRVDEDERGGLRLIPAENFSDWTSAMGPFDAKTVT